MSTYLLELKEGYKSACGIKIRIYIRTSGLGFSSRTDISYSDKMLFNHMDEWTARQNPRPGIINLISLSTNYSLAIEPVFNPHYLVILY